MKSVKVKGMSCQHCVIAVTKTLTSLDGIKNVEVDLQNGVVTYQEDQPVAFEKVAEAIRKAGYEIDG
jgi:copper ion binding protein